MSSFQAQQSSLSQSVASAASSASNQASVQATQNAPGTGAGVINTKVPIVVLAGVVAVAALAL